ncbi:MAG TPA: PBP1A family penicillin-binding protein, partial [Blastocatellia bacterium]|nr:PBP1A family penicillin-binding protein [Blastocatellia bacterium]
GVVRALRTDVDKGEFVQGGSTLTQQIIKNNFLSTERTLSRKIKEAAMAVILESRLTKEQIFTVYFNDVYLGQSGTFAIKGFGQAAQAYFDKDVSELTLAESAFLAGLICAPNRYSAHRDQARAIERRNLVLDAMVQTGAISSERAAAAKAEPLRVKNHLTEDDNGTTYFIDYVQRFTDSRYGDTLVGQQHSVTTTLDPLLQQAAFAAVKSNTAKLDKQFSRKRRKGIQQEPVQAALVALDAHTGEVLAMIGGRNYDESQLNRATDAKRQPGSAFKPFVYATAINSRKFTAASVLSDRPKVFDFDGQEYQPSDYHGGFTNRDVTLREALSHSLNVPAVQLAMNTGLGKVAALAEASGLDAPRMYPSMALGTSEVTPLQLAGAYTAFANDGIALRPVPINNIEQVDGSQRTPASSTEVFSPQVAYLMTNMLQDVVDRGTASRLRAMGLKGAIAGKTGTTNDGWFVGYTPNIVCVAWIGFDDNRELGLTGSESALPLWVDFMKKAIQIHPELGGASFPNPGGLVSVDIDPVTGCVAGPYSLSSRRELFLAGTAPNYNCVEPEALDAEDVEQPEVELNPVRAEEPAASERVIVEVCSLTGLIATKDCPQTEKREFDSDKAPRVACHPEFHRDPR